MNKKIMIALVATIVMMLILQQQGRELKGTALPMGIVSFEMASSIQQADAMIQQVGSKPLKTNVYIDFGFIIAYSLLLYFCCKALSENFTNTKLKWISLIFIDLSLLVGALDMFENIVMLMTISENGSKLSVTLTRYAAIAKFSMAGIMLSYIFIASLGWIIYSVIKRSPGEFPQDPI